MSQLFGFFTAALLFLAVPAHANSTDQKLSNLARLFAMGHKALKIPQLALGYEENLNKIPSLAEIARQRAFFHAWYAKLLLIDRSLLGDEMRYQYDTLSFQMGLEFDRLNLEKQFRHQKLAALPKDGLFGLPNGKRWYEYYVRKWTSSDKTPAQLVRFGTKEIARVRAKMFAIQDKQGFGLNTDAFHKLLNDASFWITDPAKLKQEFISLRATIQSNLPKLFDPMTIPEVGIEPDPKPTKDSPPGYYDEGIFYYSFFGNRFADRSLGWLFIHEAIPGHHYQGSVAPKPRGVTGLFWFPGFTEGWGAYAEDLGWDLGAYQDPYRAYGKWEWDLVRSARVVLDVGVNYQGWSRDKALEFWNKNVPNQAGIAEREVDRVRRWPAQVLAYKVGESEFLKLRALYKKAAGDPRSYHTMVLKRGTLPLPVLREIVNDHL